MKIRYSCTKINPKNICTYLPSSQSVGTTRGTKSLNFNLYQEEWCIGKGCASTTRGPNDFEGAIQFHGQAPYGSGFLEE